MSDPMIFNRATPEPPQRQSAFMMLCDKFAEFVDGVNDNFRRVAAKLAELQNRGKQDAAAASALNDLVQNHGRMLDTLKERITDASRNTDGARYDLAELRTMIIEIRKQIGFSE